MTCILLEFNLYYSVFSLPFFHSFLFHLLLESREGFTKENYIRFLTEVPKDRNQIAVSLEKVMICGEGMTGEWGP